MERSEPADRGESSRTEPLAAFGRRLLGVSVIGLWRLVTVTADGTIPLLSQLVLDTDAGFVTLSYTQEGLSCRGPMRRSEIRWGTEPDLVMEWAEDVEEWLDLGWLEEQTCLPEFPLFVEVLTGWFGVGRYSDALALILSGGGRALVIMTTDEFDLRCVTRQEARRRAELVVANMGLRLVDYELRL